MSGMFAVAIVFANRAFPGVTEFFAPTSPC